MAQSQHTFNSDTASTAWSDAYAWAEECDRREEERAKPYPVITPCLLIAFAIAVFAVNLAVFGKAPL